MQKVTVLRGAEITDYEDDRGNRVIGSVTPDSTATLRFSGSNCTFVIGEKVTVTGGIHFTHSDGRAEIGDGSHIKANFAVGEGATIRIGKSVGSTGDLLIVAHDTCTVSIGDDCLFAQQISVRAWDSHPIYDLRTRERTNFGRDISIGSDVWVGYGATITGGATIGHGSIVGTHSIVTGSTPIGEHELAVGQPAKTIRRYVSWAKGGTPAPTMAPHAHSDCLARLEAAGS